MNELTDAQLALLTDDEREAWRLWQAAMNHAAWGVTTYSGGLSFGGPPSLYAGTDHEYGEPRRVPMDMANVRAIASSHNTLPSLLARLADTRAALQLAHDKMDDLNAYQSRRGMLCHWCHADRYDGVVGVVHDDYCPIVAIRRALATAQDRG